MREPHEFRKHTPVGCISATLAGPVLMAMLLCEIVVPMVYFGLITAKCHFKLFRLPIDEAIPVECSYMLGKGEYLDFADVGELGRE